MASAQHNHTSTPAPTPAPARGRRFSKGQATASITILPRSAHSFDDALSPTKTPRPEAPLQKAMQRQDSGYESLASVKSTRVETPKLTKRSPRSSRSSRKSADGTKRSPTARRVTGMELNPTPPTPFQFPEPDIPVPEEDNAHRVPTPTTHYWTSDHTRRLEYEAIDAARRGVRGWFRRYLVPGCLAPKDGGHLDFDDDSGSVRRYRLDLEEVDVCEGRRGWFSWGRK